MNECVSDSHGAIKAAYYLGVKSAEEDAKETLHLTKLAGVGWDIRTYTQTPDKVLKLKNEQIEKVKSGFDDYAEFGRKSGMKHFNDTSYKLNLLISDNHTSDGMHKYIRDDAYSDKPSGKWLTKPEARKALAAYEAAATDYHRSRETEAPRKTRGRFVSESKNPTYLLGSLGAAAGAGIGHLLSKSKVGGGAIGGVMGLALGSGMSPRVEKKTSIPKTSVDNIQYREADKKMTSAFIRRMRMAIADKKVKAIGLEYE